MAAGVAPVAGRVVAGEALERGLVEVRHTGTAKGFGVFATSALADNTWLGDYVGEVLTQARYLKRYPREDAEYVLGANEDYNVDARDPAKSSYLRYLNHAPAAHANVFFEVAKVRRRREKELKFYTGRAVAAGEELCFDYGKTYWEGRGERLCVAADEDGAAAGPPRSLVEAHVEAEREPEVGAVGEAVS